MQCNVILDDLKWSFFCICEYARESKVDFSRIGRNMRKYKIANFFFKTKIYEHSYFYLAQKCRKPTRDRQKWRFFQQKKRNKNKIRIFWGKRAPEMDSTQNSGLEKVWLKTILSEPQARSRVKDFGLKIQYRSRRSWKTLLTSVFHITTHHQLLACCKSIAECWHLPLYVPFLNHFWVT